MHSVQTPYHRATNSSRCPQWPGHLSTVAGRFSRGCHGSSSRTVRRDSPIPLGAKESFAPRKNFTIRDDHQRSYQGKCTEVHAHPDTGPPPSPLPRQPRAEAGTMLLGHDFPPSEAPEKGHYSIRVKHRRGPLDNGRSHVGLKRPRGTVAATQPTPSPVWTTHGRSVTTARTVMCTCMSPVHGVSELEITDSAFRRPKLPTSPGSPMVQTSSKWRSGLRPHRSHPSAP